MNIFFWDIDGTLVRTSKSGIYAFAQATRELWKHNVNFDSIEAAGMTDNYIAAQIIAQAAGRSATEEEISALVRRYEQLLPAELCSRGGRIMPSVKEILEELDGRRDCMQLLLTGNSRTGAEVKLKYFELDHYFDFDHSAFCDVHQERISIARCGEAAVKALRGEENDTVFIIGDTPHDIACGKAIGARTVAVATGRYTLQELKQHEPWWAAETLPNPSSFLEKLNLL